MATPPIDRKRTLNGANLRDFLNTEFEEHGFELTARLDYDNAWFIKDLPEPDDETNETHLMWKLFGQCMVDNRAFTIVDTFINEYVTTATNLLESHQNSKKQLVIAKEIMAALRQTADKLKLEDSSMEKDREEDAETLGEPGKKREFGEDEIKIRFHNFEGMSRAGTFSIAYSPSNQRSKETLATVVITADGDHVTQESNALTSALTMQTQSLEFTIAYNGKTCSRVRIGLLDIMSGMRVANFLQENGDPLVLRAGTGIDESILCVKASFLLSKEFRAKILAKLIELQRDEIDVISHNAYVYEGHLKSIVDCFKSFSYDPNRHAFVAKQQTPERDACCGTSSCHIF
eukprot:CAMPEP_0114995804 /NCGR_PEP_ID=MMETSP0216-20121206/13943_1 /TAXON_ID=223996 /ORGANISM="Protocruzia adherens, Strain Boccale" /LENGTH=345 /DNA_ID=CAMNT_0002359907 /DNA_START=71 /DNA_END=1108 /DNA_ORIENTATION=-